PVVSTEVVDPHTIRMRTNGVFPLLPIYLAQYFIISRKAAEGLATEDFNSGKAAIGTGPFRFVAYRPGDRVELDRNDSYWGPKARRVRQGLSMAINRQAIVDRVMEGAAVPAGQYLPPGVYSHVPDLKPPAYDPEKAKKLLSEAGYPKGLRIALHGPNDRYVND